MASPLRRTLALLPLLTSLLCPSSQAQARFDLPGPKIDIRVTRAGVTLPIAQVPNLQPADQIWLHPDLPASQSVHYLLIAAFLRGTTNPPPDSWFIRIETWQRRVREEGVIVTVPPEAQQAVLFLAPETGGDFTTLRSAVKGRPGIFVRATQDLNEAGFEQARIEKYIAEMRRVPPADAAALAQHSNLLARTLALRPNPECFKRDLAQQASCLTQSGSQTLLDDGHAQSVAAALSNGPSSDLINQASYTRLAGAGNYSAYVGAIVDLVRLTSSLHTAKYQYIPAIAFPGETPAPGASAAPSLNPKPESLALRLNTAPSFNNPKSVIVIGLPAIQPAAAPPLRPVDPAHISCLLDPYMVLPVEGAPLVFSTAYAHDLTLHLITQPKLPGAPSQTDSSSEVASTNVHDIPLLPDPYQGGLILDPNPHPRKELPLNSPATPSVPHSSTASPSMSGPTPNSTPGTPIQATVQGFWGFDPFTGPAVSLQQTPATNWRIVEPPQTIIIAGQPNHLQLVSTGTACIRSIALEPASAKVDWKLASIPSPPSNAPPPSQPSVPPVDLTLNLQQAATPGTLQLTIQQFGSPTPDHIGTRTFAQPAHLEALRLHAGDPNAELTGTSLDQVKSLTLRDRTYLPACESPVAPSQAVSSPEVGCTSSALTLSLSPNTKPQTLKANEKLTATILLQDGRTLDLPFTVLPPRPVVSIFSTRITQPTPSTIHLTNPANLPLGAALTIFLKSSAPFPRAQTIEIANADGSLHTTLSVAAGTLILEDAHTVLATFDPLKAFGPSTFGPFRLRALAPDATPGSWLPLATVVRLPTLTALHCPQNPAQDAVLPCTLSGTSLYLIDSISPDPTFATSTPVPQDLVDPTLSVPHGTLYLRLRDDPTPINQLLLSPVP